jgi:hypothetical protein
MLALNASVSGGKPFCTAGQHRETCTRASHDSPSVHYQHVTITTIRYLTATVTRDTATKHIIPNITPQNHHR